jgi:hypothetical protein
MRRMRLVEIHDHPAFPGWLRDLVTDALEAMWDYGNVYRSIAPMLRRAVEDAGVGEVVDLCSGGGGPWLRLARDFAGFPIHVCLTDKYPNLEAFEAAASGSDGRLAFVAEAVDAAHVPAKLNGFRTMFSAFHHFDPDQARLVLRDAVENGAGIGVFEAAGRSPKTMLLIFWVPLMALGTAPFIRPFRWSRLLWTYLAPVVPFVLWFDGLVSCLRAYSREELAELAADIPAGRWEIGEARTGLIPITYMIGLPEAES